jgi:hypothetical protein
MGKPFVRVYTQSSAGEWRSTLVQLSDNALDAPPRSYDNDNPGPGEGGTPEWDDVTNKPSTFPPATHAHAAGDVTSGQFTTPRLASGTPDGTKFVRDDGVLATPPAGSNPPLATTAAAGIARVDNDSAGNPQSLTAAGHLLDANPHGQYVLFTEIGAPDGAASLNASGQLEPTEIPFGSGHDQIRRGDDAAYADARTPTAHHTSHEPGGSDAMAVDAATGTGSLRTLGTGAQQAASGADNRLTDARTPTVHATSHKSGGTDAIKLDELAAPADVTTLNATTLLHGLLPKLSGSAADGLRGDGTWVAIPGGSDLSLSKLAPSADVTVTAGYSAVAVRHFAIASGKKLAIGAGARFRIL